MSTELLVACGQERRAGVENKLRQPRDLLQNVDRQAGQTSGWLLPEVPRLEVCAINRERFACEKDGIKVVYSKLASYGL